MEKRNFPVESQIKIRSRQNSKPCIGYKTVTQNFHYSSQKNLGFPEDQKIPAKKNKLQKGMTPKGEKASQEMQESTPSEFKQFLLEKMNGIKKAEEVKYCFSEGVSSKTQPIKRKTIYELKQDGKLKGSKLENYKIIKKLGRGAYAEVKQGIHYKTKDGVALKIYEKVSLYDSMKRNNVLREISILGELDHPNIIKIFDCIDTSNQVVIVLELVKGESLKEILAKTMGHRLSEEKARQLFCQLSKAVHYCHSHGFVHRDLKLDNVLVTPSEQIKLIDFGFSISSKSALSTFCGTPTYMAPEIINKGDYSGPPTDMWALGIILFAMLCGIFPFQAKQNKELYQRITKGIFSIPPYISTPARNLLQSLLCIDPTKRISSSETCTHEFMAMG